MDLWGRARGLAEEAARRSQELTAEAARRSQDLRRLSSGFVSDTAKRSLDVAAHASRAANFPDLAGQIKSFAVSAAGEDGAAPPDPAELARFGVTEELREFVREITIDTFKDFPMEDEPDMAPVPAVSNVRQDLTQWQARHATLVLSTVKEISKLRYELCPRRMKERKFWRIYFILVDSHVAPHELRYNEEEAQSKAAENKKINDSSEGAPRGFAAKPVTTDVNEKTKTSTSSAEQDLDVFLLGDMESSDEGPDDADDADFDDDFDKIVSSSALDSEDDSETKAEKSKEEPII